MKKLTPTQAAIITAYTGTLAGSPSDFHTYAEKKMGRVILSHEFYSVEFMEQLRLAAYEDLMSIVAT